MPPKHRTIIFSETCSASADRLGGFEKIDRALAAIVDALSLNPYGFRQIESDWFSARFEVTKPVGDVPPLLWTFRITKESVVIEDVEEYEDY